MADPDSLDQRSVTEWLEDVKRGVEGEPQQQLMHRFLHRLEALARTRIRHLRGYEDEHDVALSAMNSFLTRAPVEDFSGVTDRKSLWALLATITINQAITTRRKLLAQKRDVRREISLEVLMQHEPSAEFVDSVVLVGNRLLESLDDELLRKIALMKMEGYANDEIAASIQRSVKTVERKLQRVRKQLCAEFG